MSLTQTVIGAAVIFGVASLGIQVATPERPSASLPPAIHINEITIRDDGTTVYDRDILVPSVWQAWSGQIVDDDYNIVCSGGDLSRYTGPLDDPEAYDVNWLVGDNCGDVEAGMRFVFTWTPIGPDFSPVRYPQEGYGIVQQAE